MITTKQRIHLMAELWPNACAAQGWQKGDDQRRYEVFAEALGHLSRYQAILDRGGHISTKDMDNGDFDLVKKHLLHLADKINIVDQEKKRLLWVINVRIAKCLALYVYDPGAYIQRVLLERFKIVRGVSTPADLSTAQRWKRDEAGELVRDSHGDPIELPSQLKMLVMTLTGRVDALRRQAGHSGHEMHQAAGLECRSSCVICFPPGQPRLAVADQFGPQDEPVNSVDVPEEGNPF